jgi:2',3'-cyclic-nucleotide 2'-phosphodiesterase (5'-nucleotidase family)
MRALAAVAAAVTVAVFAAGCGRNEATPGRRAAGAGATADAALAVFYTCDTQGHLHPCDCDTGREGGVVRRLAFLNRNPAPRRLLVDAGNVTAGRREWERLEFEYLLKCYARMGYDAVNLGHREAGFSAADLRRHAREFPRLVCANLVDPAGACVVAPYVVANVAGGPRVGIIGVMDDSLPAAERGEGLRLLPPDMALGRHLPDLARRCDTIVLLAFADEETMTNLANLFYEIRLVIGGKVRQPSATPLRVNEALIAYITDKGKSIGRLDLLRGADGGWTVRTNRITALAHDEPGGEAAAAIVADYERALTNLHLQARGKLKDDSEGLSAIAPVKRDGTNEK